MKTNIQQNLIKKPINGSEQFFISDAVVFCNKCCAHAKYEMKDKYDGFSCHCFEYIRGENVGFSYDDNHMNGNTDSMFKVSPSRISPKDTVNIYDVNEQFVRTEDVSFDEFIEVLNEEEVKWFEKNSEKIRDIYLAREDEEKKDSQVNGWEKDGQKLFGDAMRKYRPEHRYLFIGDIEMDASVVRAAELMKEATGVKIITMGDVVDRGAKYPWNTDGKYVVDTLMRITDHFLIGTHEAAFFLRAMDEIREDGEVSELLYEMYFNSDNLHGGWSNGGYKTASELLEVSKFPSGLEASKGMYFMSIRERLSVALRDPDNYFARFGDWMREHGKLSIILETSDGKKVMAVHGGVPVEKSGELFSHKGLSGKKLLDYLEEGLRGSNYDAYRDLTRNTMSGKTKTSPRMNPVWFIARKYISMGKKKWENFLKSVGVDIVVVGHDDHLPYMAYNGTLYGLDQSGRDRDYSLSHQERGERSDIFLFL